MMNHPLLFNLHGILSLAATIPTNIPHHRKSKRDRGRESVLELRGLLLPSPSPPVISNLLSYYALNKLCKNPGVP
jgi:hypothetical protein